VYIQLGHYDPAIADFNQALDLDPSRIDAYRGLGDAYLGQQRYDEARSAYKYYLDLKLARGEPPELEALLHYVRTLLYPFGIAPSGG
jgi:tetratricopeptide (TPR) repeat protein